MTTTGKQSRAGAGRLRAGAGLLAAAAVTALQGVTGPSAQALTNSFVTSFSDWSITTAAGIRTLNLPMSFTDDPGTAATYFYNNSFHLPDGEDGFIGLQTDTGGGGKTALFSLFTAPGQPIGTGTPGAGADCIAEPGGPAMSCRLPYSWTSGHSYLMRVQRTATNTFTGSVVDRTTGVTSRIGSITAGADTITGTVGNYVEYVGPDFPSCNALALSRVTFGVPKGDGVAGQLAGTSTGEGACRSQRTVTVLASGAVRHRIGTASRGCGFLFSGFSLNPGQSVLSCGGRYALVHQTDGNVVLYELAVPGDVGTGTALWDSGTGGQVSSQLAMQKDGNLVLYGPGGEVLWTPFTFGNPGAFLKVQTDGNLVIYTADGTGVLWTRAG